MRNEKKTEESLRGIMAREITGNPHAGAIIEAFRPLLLARARLLANEKWPAVTLTGFDPTRFGAGIPLSRQAQLFFAADPWEDMTEALTSAIGEGFPLISRDMGQIAGAVRGGDLDMFSYFGAPVDAGRDGRLVAAWAEGLSISAPVLDFLLRQLSRVVLEKRLPEAAALIGEREWRRGYCPVCGEFPSIALIEEKITRRWLHCSGCGHEWIFSRVICPYCEREAQQGMDFFFVEDRPRETAFSCDQCRRYLVTLKGVSELAERDLDITAMSLAHLDVIMQEKGFSPMTDSPWHVARA
ncbi:MAG: formate dehydrogenase accessory protein FdhE [Pseudomonadota bacterium]|nr:formate dehydrogenase accessory protein FdhE [Pseudomonadota bacterium]